MLKLEYTWTTTDSRQHKALLLDWAEKKPKKDAVIEDGKEVVLVYTQYTLEETFFILKKVIEINDEEVSKKYVDYFDHIEFVNASLISDLVDTIKKTTIDNNTKDKLFVLLLRARAQHISHAYPLSIKIFDFVLNEENYPLTKKIYHDTDHYLFESALRFVRKFDLDEREGRQIEKYEIGIVKFLYRLILTDALSSDRTQRYIDILFSDIDHYMNDILELYNLIQIIEKTGAFNDREEIESLRGPSDNGTLSLIREATSRHFSKFNYPRSIQRFDRLTVKRLEHPIFIFLDNTFFIQMANHANFSADQKSAFFEQLISVLKDIIENPKEEAEGELQAHIQHFNNLNDQLRGEFNEYLFEKHPDLSERLLDETLKVQWLREYVRYVFDKKPEVAPVVEEPAEEPVSESTNPTVDEPEAMDQFFRVENWEERRNNTLGKFQLQPYFSAIDKIAVHARQHLDDKSGVEGQQKYAALAALLVEMQNTEGDSLFKKLLAVRDVLTEHLDSQPKDSQLLRNRGGFFGAYKTVSKCLSAVGFKHFKYNNRTAESTTDHLLIALLDTINEELESLALSMV